jgi:hypothetical protein
MRSGGDTVTGSHTEDRISPTVRRRTKGDTAGAGGGPNRPPETPPAAGHSLLEAIDAVLALLTAPAPLPADGRRLSDELRLALARTAARGETCLVFTAADGVRLAADLLLENSVDGARQALRAALTALAGTRGRTAQPSGLPAV